MADFSTIIKTADFKTEKHAPVIECENSFKADAFSVITVSVGKEIRHPNTTEHFISWIDLYFKPEGNGAVIHLGHSEFTAHAESAQGANQGMALSDPLMTVKAQLKVSGTLLAMSYCNIHGLWQSEKNITVG